MEATNCELLITDVSVLGPGMVLSPGSAIAINDGRIVQIGPSTSLESAYRTDYHICGAGKLALPGMVDAHTHACQQLLRGRITDEPPMIWVRFLVPFESALEPEDVYWSGMACCSEMIHAGITSFADSGGRHMGEVARAAEQTGLRACIARSTMDAAEFVPANMKDTVQSAIAETEALYRDWHGRANGRIQVWFALRQVMTSTPQLVRAVASDARQYATGVHIHLAEHLREVEHCVVNYRLRPAEWLDSLGLLGPNVLAAHCVVLSDREVQLLVERGTVPVHCPRSNLHSHGFPKTPLLLALGSAIGLGSDGASSAAIDLFEGMRLLKSACQAHYGLPINDATVLPIRDAWRIATLGGARALGLQDDIGTLEAGKKADLILLDVTGPHFAPTHNLVNTMVMAGRPHDVTDVIIDGTVVMRDRVLTRVDEAEIRARATEHMQAVAQRANL